MTSEDVSEEVTLVEVVTLVVVEVATLVVVEVVKLVVVEVGSLDEGVNELWHAPSNNARPAKPNRNTDLLFI
jgi:hypothetical protein